MRYRYPGTEDERYEARKQKRIRAARALRWPSMRTDVNDRADGDRDDAHALHAPVCTARRTDTMEKKRRTHYSIFENE